MEICIDSYHIYLYRIYLSVSCVYVSHLYPIIIRLGEKGVVRGEDALYTSGQPGSSSSSSTPTSSALQTQALASAPETRNVVVSCVKCPKSAVVDREFVVTIRITNGTSQDINVQLQLRKPQVRHVVGTDDSSGLVLSGVSSTAIGRLSGRLPVCFYALKKGKQ